MWHPFGKVRLHSPFFIVMGQQQLLLLVLATVIIGLAVAVSIDAFAQNRRKAEVDVVVERLVTLASIAQTWKMTPAALGGGQGANGFEGVLSGFDQMGWSSVPWRVTAYNPVTKRVERKTVGCYRPNERSIFCPVPQFAGDGGSLVIYGLSNVGEGTGNSTSSDATEVVAVASVTGTGVVDVTTNVLK